MSKTTFNFCFHYAESRFSHDDNNKYGWFQKTLFNIYSKNFNFTAIIISIKYSPILNPFHDKKKSTLFQVKIEGFTRFCLIFFQRLSL